MMAQRRLSAAASRYVAPVIGIAVGLVSAAAYWLAAQLWPTSVAVVLCMLASLAAEGLAPIARPAQHGELSGPAGLSGLYWVFVLLIEYNALMALSSANVPIALPEFLPLGLILVAGHAASRALSVDLSLALVVGLAPAALLGIPGLAGLAAAIVMRLMLGSALSSRWKIGSQERLEVTQRLTGISFYLGALATWKYV